MDDHYLNWQDESSLGITKNFKVKSLFPRESVDALAFGDSSIENPSRQRGGDTNL